jgi:hypothetical protein
MCLVFYNFNNLNVFNILINKFMFLLFLVISYYFYFFLSFLIIIKKRFFYSVKFIVDIITLNIIKVLKKLITSKYK